MKAQKLQEAVGWLRIYEDADSIHSLHVGSEPGGWALRLKEHEQREVGEVIKELALSRLEDLGVEL